MRNCVALFQGDPLLSDLPGQVTLDEVNSQLALHYGQAMTVKVIRDDGAVMRMYALRFCLAKF